MRKESSVWLEGMLDAVAFVAGALAGFGVGQLLGLDIFAPGYGVDTMAGILLVGVGAGLGRRLLRGWLARRQDTGDAG